MARARIAGAFGAALLVLLSACGKAAKDETLHVYNWTDYIDPALLEEFTRETGIKVVYDTFDSNEVLETKLLTGGTGYDLAVPANSNLARLIQAGAILPLDPAKTPNAKNLWPEVIAYLEPFDPGRRHSVPYMWGTVGIGYNEAEVAKRLPGVAIDSWKVVFDPALLGKLKDCGVYVLDNSEDMFSAALNYLGKDPNSSSPADYAEAKALLAKLTPNVRKFTQSEALDALAAGDICLTVNYSGDVLQAKDAAAEGVKVAYAIPKEGTQVWFDVFAMPKDAPNPDAAYKFLDFMLRPEVIARASNFTQYANANSAATPLVDAAVKDNPNVYPTEAMFARFYVTRSKDQALLREVNRAWTQVKTGR